MRHNPSTQVPKVKQATKAHGASRRCLRRDELSELALRVERNYRVTPSNMLLV